MNILLLIGSYLLGAIPFGLFVGKIGGVDVRKEGSQNIGATNVSRVLGKKFGVMTLVCDVAKGYVPMLAAATLLPEDASKLYVVALCGFLAVVGHMFPVYLGFRGGKGVATGLGVFLFLSPLAIVASLLVFILAVYFTGFVSVGSLLASAFMPLCLFLLGAGTIPVVAAAGVAALIWIKHHENISRLLRGEEKTWKKK